MKTYRFLACLGLTAVCFAVASPAQAAVAGYVQFVSGDVQIIDPAGRMRPAQKGEAINEGDTLASAQKSSAQIKMQDGGFVAVRPETRLKFDQFVFVGKEDGTERGFFSLFKGGFRAVTGLIGRVNKQNYRVTTPAATIGIRGTDHETFLITPDISLAQVAPTGAYNKVNIGETYMATNVGTIFVKPNQMGFAAGMDQMPQIQPINTNVFTVAEAPAPKTKAEKKEEKEEKAEAKQEEKVAKEEKKEEEGKKEEAKAEAVAEAPAAEEEAAPVRETAVVDAQAPATGGAPAATAPETGAATAAEVVVPPTETTTTTLTTAAGAGGTTVNITAGTATTAGGQTVPVTQAVSAALAQSAADAALAAANAAAAAATAAATADAALAAMAPVDTIPASTAITTANGAIGTASPSVASATALTPADAAAAATNAAAAQSAAAAAAQQASTAGIAYAANGSFADGTAASANTAVQSANGALQSANTTVQTAAADVAAQNTALAAAQAAAGGALSSASTNLSTANTSLNTANTQNAAIATAQGSTATSVAAAQIAAGNAQMGATAAQAAATQAATLQAAGDLAGAQAQLLIAQQELAYAQQQQAIAQAAQAAVSTQLANAQAAQAAASAAVTAATTAANAAATDAAAAQSQSSAAQTAAANAAAAFAQTVAATTGTPANIVQAQAALVAANAPIAAYNNPAVVTTNRFVGVMGTIQPDAVGGYIEGGGPGAAFTGTGTANTSFVLDGAGNLVESRHAWYEETPASTATPQIVISDANIRRTGGTAVETFKMADNSIYAGRWVGGSITVTDNAAVVPQFTRNLGVTSEHWAILLAPPAGYVQTLAGTVAYNKVAATSPTDALGNVGLLNTASLTANFTSQLVDAALNLAIAGKTLDVAAAGMAINGSFFNTATQVTATCTGCGAATYYANAGGGFAGNTAASAGLNYTLWTGAAPGATTGASDLIQGMVAFSAATAPSVATNPPAGTWSARGHMLLGSTAAGWQRGRFNDVGLPPQPETSFILDGSGNLVRSLHVNYNERYVSGVSPAANQYADAMVTYSGGTAYDHFTDGSVAIGRWTGGQMIIADNQGVLPTLANNLGVTSSYWFMTRQVPVNYVQSLVGTTTYTQFGATLPADSFGNVGTLPVATLSANFTNQTVNASVAFTIANQGLNISNPAIPIVAGTEVFEGVIELGTAPTVSCTGIGCSGGGYLGWLTGGFAGAQAASANLAYKIWPTAPADSLVSDIIQGVVALSAATPPTVLPGGPFVPYSATSTSVAYTGSYGSAFNFIAAPGEISPAGNPTMFTENYGVWGGYSRTDTLIGANTATPPTTVTTTGGTPITYGVWESVSSVTTSEQFRMEPGPGNVLPVYMYGEQGYLDSAVVAGVNTGPLLGTFTYNPVAMTSFQVDSWATGSVTTAQLSANFTNQTVSVALAGTMGPNSWALNSANRPISFMNTANGAGAQFIDSAPAITMNGLPCTTTCVGNINGAFIGQNYAGAIVQYGVYENSPLTGMNAGGLVAFDRMPVGTNPAVTNGTPAPTGSYVVANSWQQIQDSTTPVTNGAGVLTGWGSAGWSQTMTPAAGSAAQAPVGTGSGLINRGTWGAGSAGAASFSYMPGWGQFHWITAPEPTPVYLAEVLTATNAGYNFVGGDVTSLTGGVHGTISGTTSLTANFTTQTVAASLAATVNGHNWAASTSNAPLQYLNNGNSLTGFFADSYRLPVEPGYLTVTVDGAAAKGSLAGQLVGAALDGAFLKFNLEGQVTTPTMGYEFVQGVAALQAAAPNDPATSYRGIAFVTNHPMALAPTLAGGGAYNNAARVITDASGNLLQFDDVSGGTTIQRVSGGFADQGSAVIAGATVSWGRWTAGTVVTVTDRATGASQNVTLVGGAHAMIGPVMTGPVALPTTGTYTYTWVGGTTPTCNLGVSGTLNTGSTYLQANFAAQTVNVGVGVTAAGATLTAAASNVPIQNRANFVTNSMMTGPGALAVTCTGACGTTNHGAITGGFVGPGGAGAGFAYGFEKGGVNAGTVSGVAVFQRGAQIIP